MPAVDVTWLGYLMAGVGLYYMLLFVLSLKVLRRHPNRMSLGGRSWRSSFPPTTRSW